MSINSYGQLTANHKVWDHVGNKFPDCEYSESVRPAGKYQVAPWLPVQLWDKRFEEWIVFTHGKILAMDTNGWLCPAQYGLTDATITYTADDVSAGVIDPSTGSALTTTKTVTISDYASTGFMGVTGLGFAVSKPIGVAQYAALKRAGDGSSTDDGFNPAVFTQYNYNPQHQVGFVCDYVLQLPLVPAQTTTEDVGNGAGDASHASFANNINTYNALANLPVAENTRRTTMTFAGTGASTYFVNQKTNLSDLAATGDWHINYTTGVLSVYSTATLAASAFTLTYYNYASAPTGSNVSKFACVLGDIKPGDYLGVNADSNWVKMTTTLSEVADYATNGFYNCVGQVLKVEDIQDASLLGSVKTSYDPAIGTSATGALPGYDGQFDQMPGSATGGVPTLLHYAGAADKRVLINLLK